MASPYPPYQEDNIYIGTPDGNIIVYVVEEDQTSGKYLFRQEIKKALGHGKKPVDRVLVFPELMMLFTLCDGYIDVFNAVNLDPGPVIPQHKGVSLICVERRSGSFRVCVQIKKKLYLYSFSETFQLIKELPLGEPALAMEWVGEVICLGLKKEYKLLKVDTGETVPLFPLDSPQLPMIRTTGDEFLVAKDELGVFVNGDGIPSRGNLLWRSAPASVALRPPYTVALELKTESIEIHNFLNQSIVQSSPFPIKKHFRLVSAYEGSKHMLLASGGVVWGLVKAPIDKQVQRLLSLGKVEDAIQLVQHSSKNDRQEVATQKLRKVKKEGGIVWFRQARFPEAFDALQETDVDIRELLSLFPGLLSSRSSFTSSLTSSSRPADSSSSPSFSSPPPSSSTVPVNLQESARKYLERVSSSSPSPSQIQQHLYQAKVGIVRMLEKRLFPTQGKEEEQSQFPSPLAKEEQSAPPPRVLSLTASSPSSSSLLQARSPAMGAVPSLSPSPSLLASSPNIISSTASSPSSVSPSPSVSSHASPSSLSSLALTSPARSMPFSASMPPSTFVSSSSSASSPLPSLDESLARDLNTALAKLYLELDEKDLTGGRSESLAHLLRSSGTLMYVDEIEPLLQTGKCWHALGVLYRNYGDYKKALDVWAKLGSGEYYDDNQDGVSDTIDLLSRLDTRTSYTHTQLVWDYSAWVLKKAPEKALQIFTSSLRPTPLSPHQVLEYLNSYGGVFVERYLEYLIFQAANTDIEYHTRLSLIYLNHVKSLLPAQGPVPDSGLVGQARSKLRELLEFSSHLQLQSILAQVLPLKLYEEMVILYRKMKQHEQALRILVEDLSDYERAEEYCKQYQHDAPGLTLTLLRVYLSENDGKKGGKDEQRDKETEQQRKSGLPPNAIRLIHTHATQLNTADVLKLLPPSTPITEIYQYLQQSMRHHYHTLREGQIVKNLNRMDQLLTRIKLSQYTRKSVTVTRERTCPVCQKRLGDSVLAYYPNGVTVHFKCFTDPSVCPVTGTNFRRKRHID